MKMAVDKVIQLDSLLALSQYFDFLSEFVYFLL